jgi:hypothetical protein
MSGEIVLILEAVEHMLRRENARGAVTMNERNRKDIERLLIDISVECRCDLKSVDEEEE